jgi:hypothetical protein
MKHKDTLDKVAELVAEDRQREIDRLRTYIEDRGRKARELACRYEDQIFSGMPDIYDFLMAL